MEEAILTEAVLFPEMLSASVEALAECRKRNLDDVETAVAIYLSMSAVYEMAVTRDQSTTRH